MTLRLDSMGRIETWLERARFASTAANSQPWKVAAQESEGEVAFELSIDQEGEILCPMDPIGMAAVLGLGSLTECLQQMALVDGYILYNTVMIPGSEMSDCKVRLYFRPETGRLRRNYAQEIERRRTHREGFVGRSLSEEQSQIPFQRAGTNKIVVSDLSENKTRLIRIFSELEKIRCQNRHVFANLLKEFNLDKSVSKQTGLPSETLAASKVGILFLKLCKRFSWLHVPLRLFLYPVFVWEGLKRPLRRSAKTYFLSSTDDGPQGWFNLGKHLQHVWLHFTQEDIVAQPMALNFLTYASLHDRNQYFSKKEQSKLRDIHRDMREHLNVDLSQPGILLRVGYTNTKVIASPRKELQYSLRTDLIYSEPQGVSKKSV